MASRRDWIVLFAAHLCVCLGRINDLLTTVQVLVFSISDPRGFHIIRDSVAPTGCNLYSIQYSAAASALYCIH